MRREKAALSSGCKSHPATAPAGSNRSEQSAVAVKDAAGQFTRPAPRAANDRPDHEEAMRSEMALGIWQASRPSSRRHAASKAICVSRGLHVSAAADAIRFHARTEASFGRHLAGNGGAGDARHATADPLAIHRTFLARDGGGKAPVEPSRR